MEQGIFTTNPSHAYKVDYIQTGLWPTGTAISKPWSAIPKELRDRVEGILTLKLGFEAEDVALFPRLKV